MTRIQPPAGWSLDPVREEQVREWAVKLGASTSADSVGPYSALCDALAEIDRLRAELEQARAAAFTEAARLLENTGHDDDAVNLLDIVAAGITTHAPAPAAVSGA